MLDITGLHHVGDSPDRFLDRNLRVEPRRPVDVDIVDIEAHQRLGEKVLDRLRARIKSYPAAGRLAQATKLDADHRFIAPPALEGFGNEQLVVAGSIEVTGIDEIDPRIQRPMNGR